MKNQSTILTVLCISITLLFYSCENFKTEIKVGTETTMDYSKLKAKIDSINQILEDAVLIPDYDKVLKYYTDDIVVVQDFKPMMKGKDKMRALYDWRLKAKVKIHEFDFTIDSCWASGKDVYEYGRVLSITSSETDPKPTKLTGGYFKIFQIRNDSTYLIKYMIANLDFNPCEGKE